jgi:ABC-2 type transport system ATP-binding protein
MSVIASFENVGKVYRTGWTGLGTKGTRAVQGITLSIAAGESLALLGPNRAGKTTLVKMLLALCRPTEGTVTRFGAPAADTSTLARVGYVHENQHFPRYLSARELLRFYGALTLIPPDRLPARVEELLNDVGLADRADDPISRFSKGMVQRVGLAQSLLYDPDLLILDEPTEGLDLAGRSLLRQVIADRKARGKTVILISHVLPEIERTCDRVAVVVGGKLAKVAPMAEMLRDPKTGLGRPCSRSTKGVPRESSRRTPHDRLDGPRHGPAVVRFETLLGDAGRQCGLHSLLL